MLSVDSIPKPITFGTIDPQRETHIISTLPDAAIQIEVHVVRRGPTTRRGAKAIRFGFSKAVQQILDQDVQTDQDQLMIEEMIQLKIQDPAGSIEVQTGQPSLHRIRLAAPLSIHSSCPVRSLEPQSSHLSSLNPVGVENGYDEVNDQISAKISMSIFYENTYPNRPRTSSSMAIGPRTSQARSLHSDRARAKARSLRSDRAQAEARSLCSERARTRLGHYAATELKLKLSDRARTRLGRYVATEHVRGSVVT
ncbi:hypothetical protein DY000_02053237 [Brassica cretica]|uniref:Uncharacterized protein n=1 Tax=Brassica cretica TaxID=69181 RepID=A0ABQ7ADR5_BRACR|nr:hypothetical protein DY000_02053237 [Brassica cretica]